MTSKRVKIKMGNKTAYVIVSSRKPRNFNKTKNADLYTEIKKKRALIRRRQTEISKDRKYILKQSIIHPFKARGKRLF